jgi:23S rRNA pseudouridine1911/1915/1917 synthase
MEEQTGNSKLRRDELTPSGIRILYEDNHLLVVEKPVNLPVQADVSGDADLLRLLKLYLRERYEKPEKRIWACSPARPPVGGVMAFCKNEQSRRAAHRAVPLS